jgi:hypothetical protein
MKIYQNLWLKPKFRLLVFQIFIDSDRGEKVASVVALTNQLRSKSMFETTVDGFAKSQK